MSTTTGFLNFDLTWEATARILLAVIEDGSEKGKLEAKVELMRMAAIADRAVSMHKTLTEITEVMAGDSDYKFRLAKDLAQTELDK